MSFHQFQERGQVARPGVGVEKGGFEPELSVEDGAAEDGAAFGEEGAAYRGDGVVGGFGGPEQDGADGGWVVELEAGVCLDEAGEFLGVGADLVDEGAESVAAEGFEGDGDFEDVGASGGAQGAAEEVGESGLGVVVGVEVVGVVVECVQVVGVAYGEEAGGGGLPAEFVQVEGDGVGAFDAVESVAVACAEQQSSAVGGVDVEAGAVGGAQVGDVGERVDEAGVGGARGGGYDEGAAWAR